jgi:hypothetical protein
MHFSQSSCHFLSLSLLGPSILLSTLNVHSSINVYILLLILITDVSYMVVPLLSVSFPFNPCHIDYCLKNSLSVSTFPWRLINIAVENPLIVTVRPLSDDPLPSTPLHTRYRSLNRSFQTVHCQWRHFSHLEQHKILFHCRPLPATRFNKRYR